ncbi:MAG: glutamate-1-semialdehyde 2,1-aminomutase [Bacteroidetes bacterium]|nr:glutamate-1-semialdehyde 2,1-aminomutase [Bacteroidota bacterium]
MNFNNSIKEFKKAKLFMPGGVNSPVRSFKDLGEQPIFVEKGKGPQIFDLDSNKYLDFCLSWGALVLGHTYPAVVKAVTAAIKKGTSFGTATKLETKLAELIITSMPSIEQLRFVNSGTEAVMSAIRLARGYTKKDIIIKFDGCYHGHSDFLLVKAGSGATNLVCSSSQGIPKSVIENTVSIPFNDQYALSDVCQKYKGRIAAIIVEPVPANMGVILPKESFLKFLRDITKNNNILLIFDEVITGFRLGVSGAQGWFKVEPDITCLGKIIGGGFPVGAYGARKKIMSQISPIGDVYQAGTLSGNPIAMTAGIFTLEILRQENFYQKLNAKGKILENILKKLCHTKKNIQLNCIGSMFTIFFNDTEVENFEDAKNSNLKAFKIFYNTLLREEIYFSPSQFETNFLSSKHTKKNLLKTALIIEQFIKSL